MGEESKFKYWTRDGYESTCYADMETGEGTNKHSDIPIKVAYNETTERWEQTDDWEWSFDPYSGEFVRSN